MIKIQLKKLIILATLLSIFGVAFLLLSDQALAFELFPGETAGASDFRIYITNFYKFSIGASILVATVMIMIGGVIWITSAGDQGRVGKAREFITNSIIGVVLLMGAYVMLALINPNLVELKSPQLDTLGSFGNCEYTTETESATSTVCEISTKDDCDKKENSTFTKNATGGGDSCGSSTKKDGPGEKCHQVVSETIANPSDALDTSGEYSSYCLKKCSSLFTDVKCWSDKAVCTKEIRDGYLGGVLGNDNCAKISCYCKAPSERPKYGDSSLGFD